MRTTRCLAAALSLAAVLLVFAGCAGGDPPPSGDDLAAYPPTESASAPVTPSAATHAAFARLGPGVNFGNMLDAPSEGAWGSTVQPGYPALVRQAGFGHVRLPVRWSAHAGADAQARIDAGFMARVDEVVTALLDQGLIVVMDMHHYRQLDGDALDAGETSVDAAVVRVRFLAMWQQIATHFAGRSDRLWFELYNEPHGRQSAAAWNDLASRALRVVRATNPQRIVVIGPVQWNNAQALATLELPADAQLVATVHDYEPFRFTHQQADWAGPELASTRGVPCCDAAQRQQLSDPLERAAQWAAGHGVPMYLGEFGSYGGPAGTPNDLDARADYTRATRMAAEQRGIAWAYWELDNGFGVYDPRAKAWVAPLREALLNQKPRSP